MTRTRTVAHGTQRGETRLKASRHSISVYPLRAAPANPSSRRRYRPVSRCRASFRAQKLCGREEGWNHEQSFVPFGMGLFVWKKRKAEAPVQL